MQIGSFSYSEVFQEKGWLQCQTHIHNQTYARILNFIFQIQNGCTRPSNVGLNPTKRLTGSNVIQSGQQAIQQHPIISLGVQFIYNHIIELQLEVEKTIENSINNRNNLKFGQLQYLVLDKKKR